MKTIGEQLKGARKEALETARQQYRVEFLSLSMEDVLQRLSTHHPYRRDYAYMLIAHCERGESFETFPAAICVRPDLITAWEMEHEEFAAAVQLALSYETLYWERKLQEARDKDSIQVAKFRLENLGYRNKTNVARKVAQYATPRLKEEAAFTLAGTQDLGKVDLDKMFTQIANRMEADR